MKKTERRASQAAARPRANEPREAEGEETFSSGNGGAVSPGPAIECGYRYRRNRVCASATPAPVPRK